MKSGVKRKKADTTTPSSTVSDNPVSPLTPLEITTPYLSGKIRSRRESHRSIKKPNKDLPGEDIAKVCNAKVCNVGNLVAMRSFSSYIYVGFFRFYQLCKYLSRHENAGWSILLINLCLLQIF